MFEDTLIIWGGEFGRTIYSQGGLSKENYGRDHHPRCFTMWMAGGGAKGGAIYGETDEIGFSPVGKPVHIHDVQATILHLLGINHEKLTFKFRGRDFRRTDVGGELVERCARYPERARLFADHIEVLLAALHASPAAVAAWSLAWEGLREPDPATGLPRTRVLRLSDDHVRDWDYAALEQGNFIPIQSILFPRHLIASRGGFDERLDVLEDWNLWLRLTRDHELTRVDKVTSIFHTPVDPVIRARRQREMDLVHTRAFQLAHEGCESPSER
jgi:hypothetical protein